MTLVGGIFVRLKQIAHILYHIGFLALQLHLLAVHLTNIKYLVHQILHTLGVMLNGFQLVGYLWIEIALQQFVQRTHDERQRRADIVRGVDEELHLILVQLLATTTNITQNQGAKRQESYTYIYNVCPRGSVPRCMHNNMENLGIGINAVIVGSYLKDIRTGLHVGKRYHVSTYFGLSPLAVAIQSVLVNHVLGIGKVERRELQREGVIDEIKLDALGAGASHTAYIDACKQHFAYFGILYLQVGRIKRGDTIAEAEPDATIVGAHSCTADILATGQTITVKIAHKLLVGMFVLPKSHGSTDP